jgi:hypothetical protein
MYKTLKAFCLFLLLHLVSTDVFAQQIPISASWKIDKTVQINPDINATQLLKPFWCETCKENIEVPYIYPIINVKVKLGNQKITRASLNQIAVTNESYSNLDYVKNILSTFEIKQTEIWERGVKYAIFEIATIRQVNNTIELLESAILNYETEAEPSLQALKKKKDQPFTSVLSSGDFYKLSITETGFYKITPTFLSQNGIDASSIKLSTFKIYGNGGSMLPEVIAKDRPQDLQENAIYVLDENGNDVLDGNDYITWFAQGPELVNYNGDNNRYQYLSHDFDNNAYYFITWGGTAGKRVSTSNSGSGTSFDDVVNSYDFIIFHEKNEENFIKSGRQWWGDKMQTSLNKRFDYTISGIVPNSKAQFSTVIGIRSLNTSYLSITINNNTPRLVYGGTVSGKYDDSFISGPLTVNEEYTLTSNDISVDYTYNKTLNESAAWIDYFLIVTKRNLAILDNQQVIRNFSFGLSGNVKYQVAGLSSSTRLWDITDLYNAKIQATFADGANAAFVATGINSSNQKTFATVKIGSEFTPNFVGKIENQNLHAFQDVEFVIITHSSLLSEAERLAEFHRNYNNLNVEVVTNEQVFNEFSSGSQDVTGIRDFAKMLYDRGLQGSTTFKYLLLFGDASYDYKDVEPNNTNLVPIYQSYNSYFPPESYCSDDYYAILDDNEGYWGTNSVDEGLDIGPGRLPVTNIEEAKIVVDKILHYHDIASKGNWMQTLTFVGDDEDGNDHLGPSESMTTIIRNQYPVFNINKIWLDAYEQVSFGSGNKYPEVNEEIGKAINSKGTLIFNYVGHGGENGMAHERVVTRPEISSWNNYDKLSFYITASCELAKIDNLEIESPGELMLLNPNGGAIGMVATTRVVYIGANTDLNFEIVNNNMFDLVNGEFQTIGEIYKNTRNAAKEEVNKRCFMLLGDPAMRLLRPKYNVVTTKINDTEIGLFNDTLKALSLVKIEGEIRDQNQNPVTDYNGTLFPTFFDKFSTYKTLGNDPASIPIEFEMQNRVIYRGKSSVVNGKFSFEFVVPKDIAYNVGAGKLSYYSNDGLTDAGSAETSYLIGGTADSLADDNTPPTLKLFIDDESWIFGGTTSTKPKLYATLFDQNGINTIGSGIGREMEAILDKGTEYQKTLILNDYYIPELNSYQSGVIDYDFETLEPGRHTLSLKVWDVYNNSATDYTEFVVQEGGDVSISNLINYPNPFNKFTTFHFDHNKAGQNLIANLTITTITGKVVKSITQELPNAKSHSSEISWDGLDEFGDKLARGVYLYTLNIKAEDGSTQKKTEKLYIIN